jgi:putative Ca2+/H+ antiporter (TMEM165/GDT1 family)
VPKVLTIFLAVLVAELGDKTQLATLLFASEKDVRPWLVFVAASAALVTSTAVVVLAGSTATRFLDMVPLKPIAGVGFILIGAWTLLEYLRSS